MIQQKGDRKIFKKIFFSNTMIDIERFLVPSDCDPRRRHRHIFLNRDYDPGYTNKFVNKDDAKKHIELAEDLISTQIALQPYLSREHPILANRLSSNLPIKISTG